MIAELAIGIETSASIVEVDVPLFVQAGDIIEYDADSKPINDTRPLFN